MRNTDKTDKFTLNIQTNDINTYTEAWYKAAVLPVGRSKKLYSFAWSLRYLMSRRLGRPDNGFPNKLMRGLFMRSNSGLPIPLPRPILPLSRSSRMSPIPPSLSCS